MAPPEIVFTHDYAEACRLRDAGYEPIECAFGQHGSVLGEYAMDHHGTESHREGVALRACRDLYGARAADPRFVVTGVPDADAVLAIIALAGLVPQDRLDPELYELINLHDIDPIGRDLFAAPSGELLAWFNQQEHLRCTEAGFHKALQLMMRVTLGDVPKRELSKVRKSDMARRHKALEGIIEVLDRDGLSLPKTAPTGPVLRGITAVEGPARIVVVQSTVWGFDQWYRLAPVVVSYASRMAKVTVGCPDVDTAERLFGPGGLDRVWPELGVGWGGRGTIGGSPRGERKRLGDVHPTAERLRARLIA